MKIYNLIFSHKAYVIKKFTAKIIFFTPFVLVFLMATILLIPKTRSFGFWLLKENNPVEMATFIIFLVAGIYGLIKTIRNKAHLGFLFTIFYIVFSFFLLLVAMEEVSWGQWFFHFDTPENWAKINAQGETTLHNLHGIQGQNDYFRFTFGLGGFVGIILNYFNKLKKINPPFCLLSWFLIFMLWSKLDIITDRVELDSGVLNASYRITELIELLIGISAFLYLWLNFRRLNFAKLIS